MEQSLSAAWRTFPAFAPDQIEAVDRRTRIFIDARKSVIRHDYISWKIGQFAELLQF